MPVIAPAFQNAFLPGQPKQAVEFDGPPGPFALHCGFEAYPPGNPITSTGTYVAAGDNILGSITESGGTPVAVSNPTAHGARAMLSVLANAGDNNSAVGWGGGGSGTPAPAKGSFPVMTQPVYYRFYVWLAGLPNATIDLFRGAWATSSGTGSFNVQYLTGSGTLRPTYQNGSVAAFVGFVVPTYTWLRIEGWVTIDPNFSQCQLNVYLGDSVTALFSGTSAASFSQPPIQQVYFGLLGSTTAPYVVIVDDLAFGNTGLFGPAGTGVDWQDQPLSAQVSPAWQTAFARVRRPVDGYADTPFLVAAGTGTAQLSLTAPAQGRKVASGSPAAQLSLEASASPVRVYTFRPTAAGGFWQAAVSPEPRWTAALSLPSSPPL
jgi:hypothetical protein